MPCARAGGTISSLKPFWPPSAGLRGRDAKDRSCLPPSSPRLKHFATFTSSTFLLDIFISLRSNLERWYRLLGNLPRRLPQAFSHPSPFLGNCSSKRRCLARKRIRCPRKLRLPLLPFRLLHLRSNGEIVSGHCAWHLALRRRRSDGMWRGCPWGEGDSEGVLEGNW